MKSPEILAICDVCPTIQNGAQAASETAPESQGGSQSAIRASAYQQRMHGWQGGFTLIEVIVVVAIIAILASIAVPSYTKFLIDGRRSDAMAFLSEAAGEQVRYFSDNNQYAPDMKTLGYGTAATYRTPEGHYEVSVTNPGGPGTFLLTATPVAGGKQQSDTECKAFTISDTNVKKNTGTNTNCW